MGLVIFRSYNNLGEGLVAFSALEAAGFHPSYNNYYYGPMDIFQMLALGGLIITLPEEEVRDAREWIMYLSHSEMTDHDPLPERKHGQWVQTLAYCIPFYFYVLPAIFLPIALQILSIILMVLAFYFLGNLSADSFAFIGLVSAPVFLVIHAKYIAITKLKKRNLNVDQRRI